MKKLLSLALALVICCPWLPSRPPKNPSRPKSLVDFPRVWPKDANDPAGTYEKTLVEAFMAKYPDIKSTWRPSTSPTA